MHLRVKDPGDVQRDALTLAVKKAREGCGSCADSYLDLATSRGASAQQIIDARMQFLGAPGSDTSHGDEVASVQGSHDQLAAGTKLRSKIVTVGRGAAAVAGSAVALSQIESAKAYSGMFGTDSNTEPGIAGMPRDFYIGKLGEGTTDSSGQQPVTYFNVDSASKTISNHVAGYWFMYGPAFRPGSQSPYQYGYTQGQLAVKAWSYNPWTCMKNVFGDVEDTGRPPGKWGWGGSQGGSQQSDNAACVNGFLDGVYLGQAVFCDGSKGRLTPGIYFNQSANGKILPANWSPSRSFVYWAAGSPWGGLPGCPGDANNCAPCSSGCDTLGPVQNTWKRGIYHGCLGGMGVMVWQFWVGSCGCSGDWDYTAYNASDRFVPVGCS